MAGQESRITQENEVFTDRGRQEAPPRGDRKEEAPGKRASDTRDEDVDETLAGGLRYPDEPSEEARR